MLKKLKAAVHMNMHALDFVYRIKYNKQNRQLLNLQNECSKIDIFDSDEIIETNKRIHMFLKDDNSIVNFIRTFSESLHYGHLRSIFEYGDISLKNAISFPTIEHGCFLTPRIYKDIYGSVAAMGSYRKDVLRKAYPETPIFMLGPYIHYAKPYYDDVKLAYLKEKYGKTLMIFPQHTIETAINANYDMQGFVRGILSNIAPGFNTVAACLFWRDFDTELYDILRANGIEVLSAGYRWDYNFIRRLKTIIALADRVISNSIGSHLGYCAFYDKPFKYIDSSIQISEKGIPPLNENERREINMLGNAFSKELTIQEQRYACEPYWGFGEIKSKDEIKEISNLCKAISRMSRGSYLRYNTAAHNLLKSGLGNMQYNLLHRATAH